MQTKRMPDNKDLKFFSTSIWDYSIYDAWSSVLRRLIPNVHILSDRLARVAAACDALEVCQQNIQAAKHKHKHKHNHTHQTGGYF